MVVSHNSLKEHQSLSSGDIRQNLKNIFLLNFHILHKAYLLVNQVDLIG